jgi:hypothetical protein
LEEIKIFRKSWYLKIWVACRKDIILEKEAVGIIENKNTKEGG